MFLHIDTIIYQEKPTPTPDDTSSPNVHRLTLFRSFLSDVYHKSSQPHPYIPSEVVDIIAPMLAEDRKDRPSIMDVDHTLRETLILALGNISIMANAAGTPKLSRSSPIRDQKTHG